ncbi:MAG: lysine-sensitive aspartokinase 3 [Gemmatimonadales bacterium]|nr:lysine-sensitive aspartokinase 3 [Gemmatimonadales bacterium]
MIIAKFGGTSVQDAAAIRRLVAIVGARRADRPVVVVSAMAKVTDGLLTVGRHAEAGDTAAMEDALARLVGRHHREAEALGAADASPLIDAEAAALEQWLWAAAGRPLTPRETDLLVSHGELWSSRVVALAFAAAGLPAAWVDARQVMVTDDRFGRALPQRALLRERAQRLVAPLVAKGEVPVTQGFIGATADGAVTTLGRGGSDFTASLLGAALDAARVEIWTDVDGLMTADPRLVPDAQVLPAASYEEAAELAVFGAKVLHPATQLPVVERSIPLVILNSARPELPGTIIGPDLPDAAATRVRSISWKPGVSIVHTRAPRMLGAYGFLRAMFEVFERHEVPVDVLASSEVSVSCTIDGTSRLPALLEDLQALGETRIEHGRAIVAVVGTAIGATPGVAAAVLGAVGDINVEMISQGASSINMTFVVREADGPEAVRRLHRAFFGR